MEESSGILKNNNQLTQSSNSFLLPLSYFLLFPFIKKKFGRDPLLHRGLPVKIDLINKESESNGLKNLCPFILFYLFLYSLVLFVCFLFQPEYEW